MGLRPPQDEIDPRVMVAGGPTLKVTKVKVKVNFKSEEKKKVLLLGLLPPLDEMNVRVMKKQL